MYLHCYSDDEFLLDLHTGISLTPDPADARAYNKSAASVTRPALVRVTPVVSGYLLFNTDGLYLAAAMDDEALASFGVRRPRKPHPWEAQSKS